MLNKQAYLAIIALLLVSICFVPLVSSQDSTPSVQAADPILPMQSATYENISVSLVSPAHNATVTNDFNVSFVYKPAINGTDKFFGAALIVNGSVVAANQTAVKAYEDNTISYVIPANGTYIWNIRLQNSTNTVIALDDYNMTVSVPPKASIAVTLKSPDNGTKVQNDFNVTFTYVPSITGASANNKFFGATLIVNGTVVANNATALVAGENNSIYYKFTQNGTYTWNIRLQNDTNTITAPSNYNFTLAVYVAPTATPTPAPTAVPTAIPTHTPATPTPSPTPAPNGFTLDTWAIVIIVVFVVCGVLVAVLILLRRR